MSSSSASSSSGSSAISWPETLPVPLIERSHNIIPRSEVTLMESKRRRVRRLHMSPIELIGVQWNFTVDQYDAFRTFFIEDLNQGEQIFELITYELASTDGYYIIVTRQVAFVDGRYTFTESDNLFEVKGTLIVESEEESVELAIPIPPPPGLPPIEFPTPVVSYTVCKENIIIDYGTAISDLNRYRIHHSDSDEGPWKFYCDLKRDRTRLVFGNCFKGTKWLRVSVLLTNGDYYEGITLLQPLAPNIDAPVITIPDLEDPTFSIPPDFTGYTGTEDETAYGTDPDAQRLVTADIEQTGLSGTLLLVPIGEAVTEAVKREYRFAGFGSPPDPATMAVTLACDTPGVTMKFTVDGSEPTLSNGSESGAVINPWQTAFGLVIRAKAFKDGCESAESLFLIDKNTEAIVYFGTQVSAATVSHGCDLFNWNRVPPDCATSFITRSCYSEYNTNVVPDIVRSFRDFAISAAAGEPMAPDSGKTTTVDGVGGNVFGATVDPGVCAADAAWTDGTLGLEGTFKILRQIFTGETTPGLADTLMEYPVCFTCCQLQQQSSSAPGVGVWNPPWKGNGFLPHAWYGPDWTDYNTQSDHTNDFEVLQNEDGLGAVTYLRFQAEVTASETGVVGPFILTSALMVATLCPPATSVWEPDDLT